MLTDLRLAARHAARRPGFTLLVALTLAVGLGVNSAVFALLDAVLLKALLYRDPSRLVFVWQTLPGHNVFEVVLGDAAPARNRHPARARRDAIVGVRRVVWRAVAVAAVGAVLGTATAMAAGRLLQG